MVEVELKFQIQIPVVSLSTVVQLMTGCRAVEPVHEQVVMYDNKDGLMQTTDGRIRLVTGMVSRLAYKKPITRQGIKQEIEFETIVANPEAADQILKMMGFNPVSSYERYRTTYHTKDECKIEIDEFPFATFLEIEGEESKIKAWAKTLGLDLKDNLTQSCDTLFQEWRKERGLKPTPHMTFDSYAK